MDFSWLSEIFNAVLSLFPRRVIVRATDAGVKWSLWRKPRKINPGFRVYWPLISDISIIATARQPHNTQCQSLETSDGCTVSVAVSIAYKISDVLLAIGERNVDIDATINERTRVACANIILNTEYGDLFSDDIGSALTRECRKQLKKYGVTVESASITDFTRCRPFNLIGIPDPAGD